ncbi:MAG TPA: ion channel [Gemmatimonadaceae bacterium]|nr:ion channel [Gemmatimonadaceae bacterium]
MATPDLRDATPQGPSSPWIAPSERDLGFGSVVASDARKRLLNRDGTFNVRREGASFWGSLSLYNWLLQISWPRFFLLVLASYIVVNIAFAGAFLALGPGALDGPAPGGSFGRSLFFSIETLGTIGYGNISPQTLPAHTLMSVEAFTGLIVIAILTGIVFARFSRPVPRVLFSDRALIAPYHGGSAFMFRIANERSSQIIDLEARVVLAMFDRVDGHATRRFSVLSLERNRVALFPLSWTVVHPIVDGSPLQGLTEADLAERGAELLVLLTGLDETFSQLVHTRSSYRYDEIVWGARFSDMFAHDRAANDLYVDVSRIHAFERVPLPPPPPSPVELVR